MHYINPIQLKLVFPSIQIMLLLKCNMISNHSIIITKLLVLLKFKRNWSDFYGSRLDVSFFLNYGINNNISTIITVGVSKPITICQNIDNKWKQNYQLTIFQHTQKSFIFNRLKEEDLPCNWCPLTDMQKVEIIPPADFQVKIYAK